MSWIQKWEELEKIVKKKYAGYISIIGLGIEKYMDLGRAQVWLKIRKYTFLIGHGCSRRVAINRAIESIKANKEAEYALTVFTGRVLFTDNKKHAKEIENELRIIKECALKLPR